MESATCNLNHLILTVTGMVDEVDEKLCSSIASGVRDEDVIALSKDE